MKLLDVDLDLLSKQEILKRISGYLDSPELHHIVTINPEYIVESRVNDKFKRVLNSASIKTVDGIGILFALEYLRRRGNVRDRFLPGAIKFFVLCIFSGIAKRYSNQKISGSDLVLLLMQSEFLESRRVYLLGGRNNVAAEAVKRLGTFAPSIVFRFSNGLDSVKNPNPDQDSEIIADINSFKPDILLVAYGHPWQDLWIAENRTRLRCSVAIGVGGTFDYIARRVPRAPMWMRNLGLEWLYRLLLQPQRFLRIFRAVYLFAALVVSEG